jgi:hypothetical protein
MTFDEFRDLIQSKLDVAKAQAETSEEPEIRYYWSGQLDSLEEIMSDLDEVDE